MKKLNVLGKYVSEFAGGKCQTILFYGKQNKQTENLTCVYFIYSEFLTC